MADFDVILLEFRGFRQENKEQLATTKEEIITASTRLDEVKEQIEKAEETGGQITGFGKQLQTWELDNL